MTKLKLTELPDHPTFAFSATDMAFGVNWVFTKHQVGDYRAGYLRPAPPWPVARAVAASSCFPPIFSPLPLDLRPDQLVGGTVGRSPKRDALIAGLRLTDGAVYDNMGLEPVWKSHAVVLVSDGGASFGFETAPSWFRRLRRYTAIIDNQARSIRKRWLISSFTRRTRKGAYWGIGSIAKGNGEQGSGGYSKGLVEEVISQVRTDMDAFSEAEIAVLENHGYLVADAAIRRYAQPLVPPTVMPLAIPHKQWMGEEAVRLALKDSHRRKLPLGRW